jgi:hypothetical protein
MKTKDEAKKSRRAGADFAFKRLRCAEGAVKSDCTDMALREIADPIQWGLSLPMRTNGTKRECL